MESAPTPSNELTDQELQLWEKLYLVQAKMDAAKSSHACPQAIDLIRRLAHRLRMFECITSDGPPDVIPRPSKLLAEADAFLEQSSFQRYKSQRS